MELAGIRSVAFVDEGNNIALGFITVREVCKQFLTVLVDVRLFPSVVTVLVYQRTDDGILVFVQYRSQVGAAFLPLRPFPPRQRTGSQSGRPVLHGL